MQPDRILEHDLQLLRRQLARVSGIFSNPEHVVVPFFGRAEGSFDWRVVHRALMNDECGLADRVAYAKGNPEALRGARSFMANVGRYETWARQAWRGIDVVRQHWDADEPSSLDLSLVGAAGAGSRSWLAALRSSFHHLLVGADLLADASEAAKAGRIATAGAKVVQRLRAIAEGVPDTAKPPTLPVGIEEGLPIIAAAVGEAAVDDLARRLRYDADADIAPGSFASDEPAARATFARALYAATLRIEALLDVNEGEKRAERWLVRIQNALALMATHDELLRPAAERLLAGQRLCPLDERQPVLPASRQADGTWIVEDGGAILDSGDIDWVGEVLDLPLLEGSVGQGSTRIFVIDATSGYAAPPEVEVED